MYPPSVYHCNPNDAADECVSALHKNGVIFICGNGGSAAMASHFAAELMVRYKRDRGPIPCINLAADPGILTACANDLGYEQIFARQVRALAGPGDVLIVLSTSENSVNVIRAVEVADQMGLTVLAPVFRNRPTEEVQEAHLKWLHTLADAIEASMFPNATEVTR